jgi:hypothetical protein
MFHLSQANDNKPVAEQKKLKLFFFFLRELPSEGEAQAGGEPRASPCLAQDVLL